MCNKLDAYNMHHIKYAFAILHNIRVNRRQGFPKMHTQSLFCYYHPVCTVSDYTWIRVVSVACWEILLYHTKTAPENIHRNGSQHKAHLMILWGYLLNFGLVTTGNPNNSVSVQAMQLRLFMLNMSIHVLSEVNAIINFTVQGLCSMTRESCAVVYYKWNAA